MRQIRNIAETQKVVSQLKDELDKLQKSVKNTRFSKGLQTEGEAGDTRIIKLGNNAYSFEIKTHEGWSGLYCGATQAKLNTKPNTFDTGWIHLTPGENRTFNHGLKDDLINVQVFVKSSNGFIQNLNASSIYTEKTGDNTATNTGLWHSFTATHIIARLEFPDDAEIKGFVFPEDTTIGYDYWGSAQLPYLQFRFFAWNLLK